MYFEEIFTNDNINLEMCNVSVVSCGYHWFFISWGFTVWWNKCEKISTGAHIVIMIIMFQELLAPRFWPCCQLQVIFIPKWIMMMLIARRKLSVSSWISQKCLVGHHKNFNHEYAFDNKQDKEGPRSNLEYSGRLHGWHHLDSALLIRSVRLPP